MPTDTSETASSALDRHAVRCPRCDHPFASDEGRVEDAFASGLGEVEESAVCPRCARRRLRTLLILSLLFGTGLLVVMFLAP